MCMEVIWRCIHGDVYMEMYMWSFTSAGKSWDATWRCIHGDAIWRCIFTLHVDVYFRQQ